jgi:hypothetical protein
MKYLNVIIICILCNCFLNAQLIKAPDIHFGGSKVDWAHTVKDTFETDQILHSFPSFSNKEIGLLWTRPKEFDKKIIFNVSNFNSSYIGTMVNAYDLDSGDILWANNYNPHFENNFGYSFTLEMEINEQSNLILKGYRGIMPFTGGYWRGYFSQRTIDLNSGLTKTAYINLKTNMRTNVQTNPAINKENSSFFYYTKWPSSGKFFPVKVDIANDTIIDAFEFDSLKTVVFETKTAEEQGTIRIDGPFTLDHQFFTFVVQYSKDGHPVHWLWKTDKDANVLIKKEISSNLGEFYLEAEQKDSLIEMISVSLDDSYQGHRGYLFMDMDGNVVNRNSQITIEGKKVGHLSTTRLKNSDEVLHVVRFQLDNDIYIYRETKDKQYIKSGHLINNNSSAYAYIPRFIFQSSDNGLVISGSFLLDTLLFPNSLRCNFDCGGWPVIMKLSAETLGLPTGSSDPWQQPITFSIAPNPSTNQITVATTEALSNSQIEIYNQTGRHIINHQISSSAIEIDISSLPTGLYFVSLVDDLGKRFGQVQKLVKIE